MQQADWHASITGTAEEPKFGAWSAPGHPLQIEYSVGVLEQIREIAVDGYHRVPHGGVETGGILFGTHQEHEVRIMAWRPIVCEYARGPSFLLSEKDEAVLAAALQAWGADPGLEGLEPVGWYRAHTRSEVLLADADVAFFNRFFPQPWQVGLIVRPASFAPTRAGFFFREADGGIHAQSSYLEFTLAPVAIDQPPPPEEPPESPRALVVAADTPPLLEEFPAEEPAQPQPDSSPGLASTLQAPRRDEGAQWKWYVWAILVLIIAVLGFLLLKPSNAGLALTATDTGGQLRIAWDYDDRSISRAKSGAIDIDDHGLRTEVSLTSADLRSGNLFYARQSGDVSVRLTVNLPGGPPVVATTRFLKPGEIAAAPAARPDAVKQPQVQPPGGQPPGGPSRVETAPPALVKSTRPVIPFREPIKAPRQTSTAIPSIAPPRIENPLAAPPSAITSVLGSAPAPAPAAPPRPAAAVAVAVSSGRIIWTGRLAKNGRLVVERNHASSGAITGALPAVAARVSAYPGNLTAGGITFFTADPRFSKPLTEKAGAENGWNPTTYTWDPKRASGLRVVEQPGPHNGYKLVLESDIPKLSVVMLEWRELQ